MEKVMSELAHQPHQLQHVAPSQMHDASAPAIEPGTHLKTWDKESLLHSIEAGVPLKHVQTDDRSEPKIDPDVHVQPSHHKELLTEVRAAAQHAALVREVHAVADAAGAGDCDEDVAASPLVAQLHHVTTVDKGAPAIEPGTHVSKIDMQAFREEVSSPHTLRHVDPAAVSDRSAPAIPADAHVGTNPADAVLQQVRSGELPELRHVEAPR